MSGDDETRAVPGAPAQPYTVYDDTDGGGTATVASAPDSVGGREEPGASRRPARRRDVVALVAGVLSVLVASLAMTGTLDAGDPRWVLAGAGILIGTAVLLGSRRRRST